MPASLTVVSPFVALAGDVGGPSDCDSSPTTRLAAISPPAELEVRANAKRARQTSGGPFPNVQSLFLLGPFAARR